MGKAGKTGMDQEAAGILTEDQEEPGNSMGRIFEMGGGAAAAAGGPKTTVGKDAVGNDNASGDPDPSGAFPANSTRSGSSSGSWTF